MIDPGASSSGTAARTQVAVVGGGPAGAVVARMLASVGHEVTLFERSPQYRWRACGVFSWTALRQLPEVGLSGDDLSTVARPLPRLRLVCPGGAEVVLSSETAAGLDRCTLDRLLLARARDAGARVCEGATVAAVEPSPRGVLLTVRDEAGSSTVLADVVIGADGIRSAVARAVGAVTRSWMSRRAGLTFHIPAPGAATAAVSAGSAAGDETVMTVVRAGYCGIAPVPGDRLNVGIVLDEGPWLPRLRRDGATATTRSIVRDIACRDHRTAAMLATLEPLDRVEGAAPLAHAVRRVAGDRWLLVGDAAGFLDPFTGEGLGRALATAILAADTVDRRLRGDRGAPSRYAAAYRHSYTDRDRLTLLLQQFLARPALLSYAVRRAAARPAVRTRLEAVLTDAIPARRALDPRFLAAVLRP